MCIAYQIAVSSVRRSLRCITCQVHVSGKFPVLFSVKICLYQYVVVLTVIYPVTMTERTLREFVKTQQEIEREERRAEREKQKDELEYQRQKEKYDKEFKLQQITHRWQMELLQEKGKIKMGASDEVSVHPKGPKIPAFKDGEDDLERYLMRFERYVETQKWPKSAWATHLSALLKGKALDVYVLLPSEDALDYDKLKLALLKRYDLTEDGFKQRFRSTKPEDGETFVQFSVRLGSYLQRWLRMANIAETYEDLFDLVLRDQFLNICNRDLTLFLKERTPKSIQDMADLADHYREARLTNASTLVSVNHSEFRSPQKKDRHDHDSHRNSKGEKKFQQKSSFIPKSERKCYNCHKFGHIAPDCRNKPKVNSVTSQSDAKVSFITSIPTNSTTDSMAGKATTKVSSSCNHGRQAMPISAGYVEGKPVTVLRDTGCSGIVVRKSMVSEDRIIRNKIQTCILADGSTIRVPVATVFVDTPYISGTFEAWCMTNPVYDLIIGNVDKVRSPDDPDPQWSEAHAVETRQQAQNKQKPYPKLQIPDIVKDNIRPDDIRAEQQTDKSLQKLRTWASENQEIVKRSGKIRWFLKNGLIYREYQANESGKNFVQLVIPEKFRDIVLKLAHESIISGHLATSRTTARILTEFYWPGILSDVKRFCRSCDICQRTVQKGKVAKHPLQKMPLIDEVFKRVAVDIVGPIHPVTDKGNRYILTLVDFAYRYPEAIPMASIDTERVAEVL